MKQVSVALAKTLGNLFNVGINRCKIGCCSIVAAEPHKASQHVGQPAAGLGDEPETSLLRGDGALVDVGLALPFEVHGPPAVGACIAAGSYINPHVHRRTLVVVAHHVRDIFDAYLAGRLDEEGHLALQVVAHGVVQPVRGGTRELGTILDIGELPVAKDVECRPGPSLAAPSAAEVQRIIGIAEAEILVGTAVPALAAGEFGHIGGVHAVFGVIPGETGDAALIGMGADVAVGNAAGHPHYALLVGTLAHQVHDPSLSGVGDAEGLALGRIAVLACQRHYGLYGLAGRAGALKRNVNKRTIVHYTVSVYLFLTASPGGLPYDELMLVHVSHGLVCIRNLRYAPQGLGGVPLADGKHAAGGPFGSLAEIQLAEEPVGVGGIGYHRRPVRAGAGSDYNIGAGLRPLRKCRRCGNRQNIQ